jgi:serine/threonine-protein kinase HipA
MRSIAVRKAKVRLHNIEAGSLVEVVKGQKYRFTYLDGYHGPPISLTMPTSQREYEFDEFPPFFDGLLPEGVQLEGLLRQRKIDKHDLFQQLVVVGGDLVGAVTVEAHDGE